MADRVAQAEAQSEELPPYSWGMIEVYSRTESEQGDEGERQQSP